MRKKFESLSTQVKGNIDVLMVSETKIDDTFPVGNSVVDGFSTPYWLDRDSDGGGIMLYVREDIPSNLLATDEKNHIESFYAELNLSNEKWLINCSYNPNKSMTGNHLDALGTYLDLHSTTYEKFLILGDFNVGIEEQHMKAFCDNYNLTSLIKQPTCYKNPNNPTCIDLILSNTPRSFQSTCVIETGLSDFHLMTLTVLKKSFRKFHPRLINYRSYKNFSSEAFRESLLEKLSKEIFENNDEGLQRFCNINLQVLNQHAPQKIKYVRGNQMPFMTKQLSEEIMKSSRLRNNFLRNRTEENKILYNRQRNYCVSLLRKSKKGYYENLNIKNVTDNKLFWKSVKPLLSDKSRIRDRINISEKGKILKSESETAESLNSSFSNIVKNLNISRYSEFDPVIENIADPTFKAIFKYKDHPSKLAIQSHCEKETFRFLEVNIEDKNKASQNSDIPIKIIKENLDIFVSFLCTNINSSFKSSSFPSCLKMADVTPLHKKGKKDLKENYRPVSILPVFSKVLERSMFAQMSSFFDNFLSNNNVASRKAIVHNNVFWLC